MTLAQIALLLEGDESDEPAPSKPKQRASDVLARVCTQQRIGKEQLADVPLAKLAEWVAAAMPETKRAIELPLLAREVDAFLKS